MNDTSLYQKIRDARKKIGISQTELAALLKVSRQTVSNWENGVTVPDATTLERIADLLHVSISSLLGNIPGEGEEESKAVIKSEVDSEPMLSQEKIAQQLSRLNELYAERLVREQEQKETLKRYLHYAVLVIIILALLFLLMPFARFWYMSAKKGEMRPLQEETVNVEIP